ncbi:MAG TPA: alpha/beta hydrolase [Chloroflexia bacterium]
MPFQTFDELNTEAMRLYQQGQYAETYDLLTSEGNRFTAPDESYMTLYLRSCMAARTGRPDHAIDLIRESFDRGEWYGEQLLRMSPSYAPLQGMPEFERLVEVGRAKQVEASAPREPLVLEPEGGCTSELACPTIVALHGNTERAQSALDGWRPIVAQGWLLAAGHSSQVAAYNRYVWDDQDVALRDVAAQFGKLRERYNIDPARLIVAGFSLGGATALHAALTSTIPAIGFILLGPGGGLMLEPESWRPLIAQAANKGLRGYMLLGEHDDGVAEGTRATVEMLNEGGIPCELEVIPSTGHAYPADFGPIIARALAFVEQRSPRG